MNRLFSFLALFRQGAVVADPKTWKNRDLLTAALAALFVTAVQVAAGLGYALPFDENALSALAGAVAVIVHFVLTLVTSDKVGLPAKPLPEDEAPAEPETFSNPDERA